MKFKFFLLGVTLVILGAMPHGRALAISPDDILVNVVPENPNPGENVTISLSSYIGNLDTVNIIWSVSGKKSSSGTGVKTFSLNAPMAGKTTSVTVQISLPDGEIDKDITIIPAEMVLLWQANDSYVPPFYEGKAMPTAQSEIKVVAVPEIRNSAGIINPNSLVYNWKQDYNNMVAASGYGKNSFVYTSDYLDNTNNIDVVASTVDQKMQSEDSVNISTTDPKIIFYGSDASIGTIWSETLKDGHVVKGNETLVAVPYFISPKLLINPEFVWNWSINGNSVNLSLPRPNILPLKLQSGASGTSKIRLNINSNYKIFESVSKEINLQF